MLNQEINTASIGLKKLLKSNNPVHVDESQNRKQFESKVSIGVKHFVKTTAKSLDDKTLKKADLDWIIPGLESYNPSLLAKIDDQLSMVTTHKMLEYLQANVPKSPYNPGSLVINANPNISDSDKYHFLFKCRLADNPLHMLSLLSSGQYTTLDDAIISTIYPEIYQYITSEIITEILNTYTDFIPRKQRLMLAILLGQPVISTASVNDALEEQKRQPQPSEKAPNIAGRESGELDGL